MSRHPNRRKESHLIGCPGCIPQIEYLTVACARWGCGYGLFDVRMKTELTSGLFQRRIPIDIAGTRQHLSVAGLGNV